jgi:murein DD-endopeptidase MepM/ murein hydrolase activator NlpD
MPKSSIQAGKLKRWMTYMQNKYKLVVMQESTFEEKITLRLSRMNVLIVLVILSLIFVLLTTFIISVTPLKEYIPGYASVEKLQQVYVNQRRVDSLYQKLASHEAYIANFKRRILLGEDLDSLEMEASVKKTGTDYNNIPYKRSDEDSLLRREWETDEAYNLVYAGGQLPVGSISRFIFFTPLNGTLVDGFDPKKRHFGVDVVGKPDVPIKSVLDGMVIYAGWTYETGYVIVIQHNNDLISTYRHNSRLLKTEGDRVKAGDPIAIIGNSGKLSTGPHLHLELWYQGSPVNPAEFINFD